MKKILVVGNVSGAQHVLCEMLEGNGFRTIVARNDKVASTILAEAPELVHLVLLSCEEDAGQFSLLDNIKSNDFLKQIPVFVLSGDCSEQVIEEVLRRGATRRINKPYRAQALLEEIHTVLKD